jgi:hypothetical protein
VDAVGANLGGQIPRLENLPVHNEDGAGGHVYVPWWLYKEQLAGKLGFARGYHIEFGSGRKMPSMGTGAGTLGYGKSTKKSARRYYGSHMGFSGRGGMIPNENSFCELDPEVKEQMGNPSVAVSLEMVGARTRQAAHRAENVC